MDKPPDEERLGTKCPETRLYQPWTLPLGHGRMLQPKREGVGMAEEPAAKATVVALISVISCVVSELSKKGLLDVHDLVENIQGTASAHREKGDTSLANDMHTISEHLLASVRDAPRDQRPPSPGA